MRFKFLISFFMASSLLSAHFDVEQGIKAINEKFSSIWDDKDQFNNEIKWQDYYLDKAVQSIINVFNIPEYKQFINEFEASAVKLHNFESIRWDISSAFDEDFHATINKNEADLDHFKKNIDILDDMENKEEISINLLIIKSILGWRYRFLRIVSDSQNPEDTSWDSFAQILAFSGTTFDEFQTEFTKFSNDENVQQITSSVKKIGENLKTIGTSLVKTYQENEQVQQLKASTYSTASTACSMAYSAVSTAAYSAAQLGASAKATMVSAFNNPAVTFPSSWSLTGIWDLFGGLFRR